VLIPFVVTVVVFAFVVVVVAFVAKKEDMQKFNLTKPQIVLFCNYFCFVVALCC